MLYLVSSPIGNLGDITVRALEVLKLSDYILCENTQRSRILLKRYEISSHLVSFHKFNEKAREAKIVNDLENGMEIALLTDAGTPGISDPGARLIDICREKDLPFTAIPGASSLSMAISLAGSKTTNMQFIGFLPKKAKERTTILSNALLYEGSTLFFESPHRVLKTLERLNSLEEDRIIIVFRELTKKHEEVKRATVSFLLKHFQEKAPRGEFVFLIEQSHAKKSYDHITIEDQVKQMEKELDLSTKEAIKAVAELRDIPKRIVYNKIHAHEG